MITTFLRYLLNFVGTDCKSALSLSIYPSGRGFFDTDDKLADVNSYDASIMEKIKLVEVLNDEEKKIVFTLVDALVGKKKLKDALSGVLNDVK
jgi:hypothetical protein